jgi:acetyl-CoA carboxylase biotin carboxyl carrier protein
VTVGQTVAAGETVGLIEAMKMFTAIEAPAGGTVVAVLAENDEFVEFGQPLFILDLLTD